MLRPWKLNITISRDSDVPIHTQIAEKIIEEIQYGRFTPGTALPGTREFSNRLNINRKTVVQAYDTLVAQGWLVVEHKRGTFVSNRVSINHYAKHNKTATIKLANKMPALPDALVHSQPTSSIKAGWHDLGLESADSRLLPFEAFSRAMRHALVSSVRHNKLHYENPLGAKILREAVMQMVNIEQGLHADLSDICITRGGQMAINLTAKLLINPGDNIILEPLHNPIVRETLHGLGAKTISVKQHHEGIDLESFEMLCINHQVRAIYISPQHQMPTGISMSLDNRKGLLKLAEKYDVVIIEDDSHASFCFGPQNTPPLASMDKTGRVIYVGSLSRLLAPGLRLGYVVSTPEFVNQVANQIAQIDRHGNTITELAVAELMHSGELKRHSSRAHKIYFERRVHLLNLLSQQLSFYCNATPASHGLGLWLNTYQNVDIPALLQSTEKVKLRFFPPHLYSENRHQPNGLRFSFGHLNQEEITDAVLRLKQAFHAQPAQRLLTA